MAARDLLDVATNPDPHRARKIADDRQCLRFLAGLTEMDGTLVEIPFPDPGSPGDKAGRSALARVVLDYIPGRTGGLLALAIDPKAPVRSPLVTKPTRLATFGPCNRGPQQNDMRDLMIVHDYNAAMR